MSEPPGLRRVLSLPATVFYGVGQILGAGIYSIIGAAAGEAGTALWWAFLVAAAVAFLTSLSYAELATAYPEAGAEYVYLRRAVPEVPAAAAVVGLIIVVAGVATASTVSLAFGGYLRLFLAIPVGAAAVGLLLLCTAVNIAGIRESSWTNIVFTLVEAAGLILVIAVGAGTPRFADVLLTPPHPGIFAAAALVFFAYLGFEDIANLADEMRSPARDLPRAILWSLGITSVLYLLVGIAAVALVSPDVLAASGSPLAAAVAAAAPRLAGVLGAVALFATANTALITLIVASRMLFGMARGGDLPGVLARVLPGRQTPWIAAIAALALAALLLPLGDVAMVGGVSSLGALIAFTSVNAALIVLRYRNPGLERPFVVPGRVGRLPLLPALGVAAAVGLGTQFPRAVYLLAAAAFGILSLAYLFRRLARGGR
jgi:APA family basic amino acid/polyamine antiporter